jgi:Holliday junction resolvase RusA-like endonuclease
MAAAQSEPHPRETTLANKQPRGLGRVKTIEDLKTDTLLGDVRDLILQEMRDAKNALPWTTRSEKEQGEMIDRADRFAGNLIAKVVNLVAAGNNPAIPVTVKQWTVSDELKIALTGAASHLNVTNMAFTVPGEVRGKGRPRIVKIGGFSRMAADSKTATYENLVALVAMEAMTAAGMAAQHFAGPVCVTMTARLVPAASAPRKARAAMLSGEAPPTKKPDADNIGKWSTR